jgi:molybdopterin molybdotransferase
VKLALFFTGDELVMPGDSVAARAHLHNSNRFTLNGMAKLFGCEVTDYGSSPDRLDATREVLRRAAAENDLDRDFGRRVRRRRSIFTSLTVEAEGRCSCGRSR